ncbi:probable E3 ubiquitin-protein ligase ARI16 [Brassica napus]|nr:probable E3 ubiquitin-protein ligase ARI16 [Brassica napus]
MESAAAQRLYSVLTRTEVRDKMMKEIVQISEVFSLSQSDATVALIHLGWDSFKASDLLGDNKERFLSKLGLVGDGDNDNLVSSTPLCSHKFCSDCWRDHLSEALEEEKEMMISCVVASVGPDTEPVKEMYERYVLGSFMDSNRIKWCPAKGCEYAIQRHDDQDGDDADEEEEEASDFGVVCLCGHTFCWRCKNESHRPVTCNNASLWLNELLDEARTFGLIATKTKPCPHCQSRVEKDSDNYLRIVTCVCSYAFCWRCLRPEEDHRGGLDYCFEVFVPPPHEEAALLHHLTLWEESHKAMEASKTDLKAIESLGELDMGAVREACALIVQCRLVLKWCGVFGYFITDYNSGKKQYLDHLVEKATANLLKHKECVDELVRGADSGGVMAGFRHKLETSTKATGNYFHVFVKTVEDGLCDVKAGVFENVPMDYWFCDRCTFQNDSFEKKCRVCVFPFEGPSPLVALGNNNGAASVHQEQELPNVSSNPFASPQQEAPNTVAFGNTNNTASANMFNNPFATSPGGTNLFQSAHPFALPAAFGNNNSIGASVHQQQIPNLANNPFASNPGGGFYNHPVFPFGSNSIGASAYQPNMANNPFAAYGNNSAPHHQQEQVPTMANNPFARPGGANPFQFPPFVGFGNSSNGAHKQEAVVKEESNLESSMESE